jgi:glycerol-3-phosphate dehydrogenase
VSEQFRASATTGATPPAATLERDHYDVVVIGGGINGAGIARAAAQRGHSVLLVEQHDFGWGTTWRSTKLIHGGLRYLEHAEFGLVFESLRDRGRLLRSYPGMVRPLEFVLPVYQRDRHRPATIALGLTIYDVLSLGRGMPGHRRLPLRETSALEPGLRRAGLAAAFSYFDCQVPYPERLCLQTVLEARSAGAETRNHTAAIGFLRNGGRIAGIRLRCELNGETVEVGASVVVNAAGPWVDSVLGAAGKVRPQLGVTKGVHIVVDYRGRGPRHAVYAEARSDHRPFFIIPWRGYHLVGTTDTRYDGPPEAVAATPGEMEYLFDEANALLENTPLSAEDVLYGYGGLRPLPASNGQREGAITRRHLIRDHAGDGNAGLLSIIGGKLSTYRSLAGQALDRIERQLRGRRITTGGSGRRTEPATRPIHGVTEVLRQLSPPRLDYLRAAYGPRLQALVELLRDQPALATPLCAHGPELEAQVVLAAREEQAVSLADVLLRRTGAGWNVCHGLDSSRRVGELLARELGWQKERIAGELARYADEVAATFTPSAAARRERIAMSAPGRA